MRIGAAPSARTPGYRFGLTVLLGLLLAIPLFAVHLHVYDRQRDAMLLVTLASLRYFTRNLHRRPAAGGKADMAGA